MKKTKVISIIFAVLLVFSTFFATSVYATDNKKVILGGNPFGVKMFSKGVMVIKTEAVNTSCIGISPAEKAGVKVNDIILSVNGTEIKTNEELSEAIENSHGNEIELIVKRDDKNISVKITPVKNSDGVYKAGLWVKDSGAGIGTITFYSEEYNGFCALGHGICETTTGMLIPLEHGEVDSAYIASVTKSVDGNVGSLNGYFINETIGNATINSNEGVFGETVAEITGTEIEIADSDEVKTGEALIYTTVSGEQPEYYEAQIQRVNNNSNCADMVIRITDEELIEKTGGIVQGMSGSPILQNNKLVGAITHVIVDDVECGYGIFAERMIESLEEYCR